MLNKVFFSKILPFMKRCGKILYSRTACRWYGACRLHAEYLRLKTHSQNM